MHLKELTKNPKETKTKQNKKLQELTGDCSEVAKYKVNIQKSTAILYSSNDHVAFKMKSTILLYLH